ncbi:hypothetical protein H8E88_31195 [candidate division KSB1 bacterium]|nr:hypothetical protein [candidate division KSB1 bacterium]
MFIELGCFIVILVFIFFEYRIRKPDHITMYESRGVIKQRRWRFYPRHFSLCITGTVHSVVKEVDAEAKGHLMLKFRLTVSVAPSRQYLPTLIRVGGWDKNAVLKATKELEVRLETIIRGFSEKYKIEEFSSEDLLKTLKGQLKDIEKTSGLEIISINIQSVEPVDEKISEAIRQRESARIFEQTETANQNARVAAAKARTEADEKIAKFEHTLDLKKYDLNKLKEKKEAELSRFRVEEELSLKIKQMDVDRKEIELLTKNPEVMMLTPQLARLAEASQSLRNARTVVSLSPTEISSGTQLLDIFKNILQQVVGAMDKKENKKSE